MNWIEIVTLVVSFLLGFAGKNIWTIVAKFASKGQEISLQLSEAFAETSKALGAVNDAINNDDTIDANELKTIVEAGKKTIIEFKDVILTVAPKK